MTGSAVSRRLVSVSRVRRRLASVSCVRRRSPALPFGGVPAEELLALRPLSVLSAFLTISYNVSSTIDGRAINSAVNLLSACTFSLVHAVFPTQPAPLLLPLALLLLGPVSVVAVCKNP